MRVELVIKLDDKKVYVNRFSSEGILIADSGDYNLELDADNATSIDITDCLKQFFKESIVKGMEQNNDG